MNLPFSSYPKEVQEENVYLHQELGEIHGHPRYQWAWSEDMWLPFPVLAENSTRPLLDYHCKCGVNVSVHGEGCNFTTPRPRYQMKKVVGGMKDKWVCTCWRPPELTKDKWERYFGGVPYPTGGYYLPLGTMTQCVAIYQIPLRSTSEEIVKAIKEHFSITEKERNQRTRDNWDRMDKAKRESLRIQCKDAFPVHEGFAGQKNNWSQGGVGDSPVLKSLQQKRLEAAITGKPVTIEVGGITVEV